MKKRLSIASLLVLIVLTGCEGTANNNIIADIFIGNEWMTLLLSIFLIVPSIYAITSEQGVHFYVAIFRRRRRFWDSRDITEFDLIMAKFSAYITLVLGGFGLLMSLYYLILY
jgi:hypothetical protein